MTTREKWRLSRIEGFAKQRIPQATLPTVDRSRRTVRRNCSRRVTTWLSCGRLGQERALVATLADAGHDPMEIAAAALRIVRTNGNQRPILPLTEVREQRGRRDGRDACPDERDGRALPAPYERDASHTERPRPPGRCASRARSVHPASLRRAWSVS